MLLVKKKRKKKKKNLPSGEVELFCLLEIEVKRSGKNTQGRIKFTEKQCFLGGRDGRGIWGIVLSMY